MDLTKLSPGAQSRIERIKELRSRVTNKKINDEELIEYIIVLAWLALEHKYAKLPKR